MKQIQVACGIIIKDHKILVTQRSAKMKLPLKWEFPGGKVIDGEDFEACLHRELKEELNIDVEIKLRLTPTTHSYPDMQVTMVPFIVRYIGGRLTLAEHQQYRLLGMGELEALDWAAADWPVVRELIDRQFDLEIMHNVDK